MTTRVFTGLKPTGQLQIGNYLGAIRPLLDLAADPTNELLVSVVDLHALTVEHDPATLRSLTLEMATTLLACGLDERATVFVQSSVAAHTELSYLLESTAAHGEMTRMIQFKEKSREGRTVRLSLLTYPALMAADILVHRAEVVPVGEDQRQHLELTTTLARRFNAAYGPVLTVPRGVQPARTARVKDLRDPTMKMGKSGADGSGVVFLRDAPDVVAAKVRRAVTDADPVLTYEPDRRPGVANLADLLGAVTECDPAHAVAGIRGGSGLKEAVAEALVELLRPLQQRYDELAADPGAVLALLRQGADSVSDDAARVVAAARHAMGLLDVTRPG
jgi:tryptophanyl-tRNA synthetase